MTSSLALSLENNVVIPGLEMGAFEALWANGVSSFKQLHDQLKQHHTAEP